MTTITPPDFEKELWSDLEKDLWEAADNLRANSDLRSQEYSTPVLGLIFLKYADNRFTKAKAELGDTSNSRVSIGPEDYQAKGILYLPDGARFSELVSLPEGENIGAKINDAMSVLKILIPILKEYCQRRTIQWKALCCLIYYAPLIVFHPI